MSPMSFQFVKCTLQPNELRFSGWDFGWEYGSNIEFCLEKQDTLEKKYGNNFSLLPYNEEVAKPEGHDS